MDKVYDHKQFEEKIYKQWEESGAMTPLSGKEASEKGLKPFTIMMPPPNANDPLHVGHAMFVAVEDILIRYHRMRGEATLWLPGTDHAGIETQFVFEKKLAKEGKSRFDFDRETLYKMIWGYVQENSGISINQMKRLGASADWTRTKFTLDNDIVDKVLDTFIKLNEDGLVYRGYRLINYCTRCGTGYSELEVNYEEQEDKLYVIDYGPLKVATTRPETMLGDVAVAVNPKDKRYKNLIGKKLTLPLMNIEIPVVADEMVDMEFGTGAVKITPAHDLADYEVAVRQGWDLNKILKERQVIGQNGKI
ncbi:class I tRNA ligase family protein, partial [Candidatus Collierbacteria bacterium]|nr:class I tRNA ligase family protein [Candidatus Collierbacteria bacterium]